MPDIHDMRFKAETVFEHVKAKYGREPYDGDVFIYMSRDRRQVRMMHFENHAFYTQEKTFRKGYKFMKISRDESGRPVYEMSWKDLVALLECPVVEVLKLGSELLDKVG